MNKKKYLDRTGLTDILDKLKEKFASLIHTHTKEDITDYIVDVELSSTSTNPVENKVIKAEFDLVDDKIQTDIDSLRDELKTYVDEKSPEIDVNHDHDDKYYTEEEIDAKFDEASDSYETKTDALSKLEQAKSYADNAAFTVKNDLLNGAGEACDTLQELGELINDNKEAVEALEIIATNKADKEHGHDDKYYTESEIDEKTSAINTNISNIINGTTIVKNAESADIAKNANNAEKLGGESPSYYAKTSDIPTGALANKNIVSESDLDKSLAEKVNAASDGNHSHLNKDALNEITIDKISKWDNSLDSAKEYTDTQIASIPTPDVSGQINEHNTSGVAHEDIRNSVDSLESEIEKKSDWNQNDETATDYIKNRTHWIESGEFTNLIYSTDNLDTNGYINELRYKWYYEDIGYKITLNGTSYIVSTMYSGDYECTIMGNGELPSSMELPDFFYTDDPFCIVIKDVDYDGEYYYEWSVFLKEDVERPASFKIEEMLGGGDIYHVLDERFIPETIARKEYVDEAIASIPTPDVSGQIESHDEDYNAHNDIRSSINELKNDALVINRIPYMISDPQFSDVDSSQWESSIVYGDGKYVAVGTTHFSTSIDGINWETPKLLGHDGRYIKGVYGSGKFVFISKDNMYGCPIAIYTEDCITWDYVALPANNGISGVPWINITFEDNKFIILSEPLGGGFSPTAYSTDCINWTLSNPVTAIYDFPEVGDDIITDALMQDVGFIIYHNNKFIIPSFRMYSYREDVDNNLLSAKIVVLYSDDCITWNQYISEMTAPLSFVSEYGFDFWIYSIAFSNEKIIATSPSTLTYFESVDGLNWIISSNTLPLPCEHIAYNNDMNLFVSTSRNRHEIMYSNDGETWSTSIIYDSPEYRLIVSGKDRIIVQSDYYGYIAYSDNGVDWNWSYSSVTDAYRYDKTDSLKEAIGVNKAAYINAENNEDVEFDAPTGGGGTGNLVEISKADYELLSEEEKNADNVAYFIPDENVDGVDMGDTDISNIGDGTVTGAISHLNSNFLFDVQTFSQAFEVDEEKNIDIAPETKDGYEVVSGFFLGVYASKTIKNITKAFPYSKTEVYPQGIRLLSTLAQTLSVQICFIYKKV